MIPPGVMTFADLVTWLVKQHHHGSYYQMAVRLKVSSGLPYQWRDEVVREPSKPIIQRLCDAYGLEYWEVKDVASGRFAATTAKLPLAVPLAGRRSSRGAYPLVELNSATRSRRSTSTRVAAPPRTPPKRRRTPTGSGTGHYVNWSWRIAA
jgi:hypothetical protein